MKLFVAIQFLLYSFCVNAQNPGISLSNIHSNVKFTYLFKNPILTNQYFLQSPQPSPSLKPFFKIDHAPGMFCKIECKLEQKSKKLLPRFRLGSLEYTEWMEGKRIWLQ